MKVALVNISPYQWAISSSSWCIITYVNFLQKEEAKESALRVQLIRERENRCALGVESNCDFFQPSYFDEDELVYDVSAHSID